MSLLGRLAGEGRMGREGMCLLFLNQGFRRELRKVPPGSFLYSGAQGP